MLKKKVFLREETPAGDALVRARVVLKNRISINAQLVKAGMAELETDGEVRVMVHGIGDRVPR